MWSRLLNCLFQHAVFFSISRLIVFKILYVLSIFLSILLFHQTVSVIKTSLLGVIFWIDTIILWIAYLGWTRRTWSFTFLLLHFSHAKGTSSKGIFLSVGEIREGPESVLLSRSNSLLMILPLQSHPSVETEAHTPNLAG